VAAARPVEGRMTESIAAIAFYGGLAALVFGAVRLARASLERQRHRDGLGLIAIALGAACCSIAVIIFSSGPKGVLPF
jgi:hypothetical protein